MEMPRAYVRKIDPPLFARVVGEIERTGQYVSVDTIYRPTDSIIWFDMSGSPPINGEPGPEFEQEARLLLIPSSGNDDKTTLGPKTMYTVNVKRDDAGKTTLSACPVVDSPSGRNTTAHVVLMDLSDCNMDEVLDVLNKPRAMGTRKGELSGFIGRNSQYLGIEEAPFT